MQEKLFHLSLFSWFIVSPEPVWDLRIN